MYGLAFLQDLAVVMLVAGLVTLLFHRLRQPVVLGYLLAGLIIGPHTPPFPLIRDLQTIRTLADIGVVVLMFSLGLELSLRKLKDVGLAAFILSTVTITAMVLTGSALGSALGWTAPERTMLGIMLALTSTTIVVKHLRDSGELDQTHGRLISGACIYDDIFVILVMVLLPGVARTGSLPTGQLLLTLLGLLVFLVGATVVGLLLVPRLVRYVARSRSDEMLLVLSLGLCFGMALLAMRLDFSAALGAFLMGAILAETREHGRIAALTAPIRDMFSGMFFVSIGMLIVPGDVVRQAGPVLLVTAVYVVAKTVAAAVGALAAGADSRLAFRVGTNMAQVGEFALILASIASSLHLIGDRLYPLIAAVAALNALVRPYLVGNADRIAAAVAARLPASWVSAGRVYRRWYSQVEVGRAGSPAHRVIRSVILQISLNLALIAAAFIAAALLAHLPLTARPRLPAWAGGPRTLYWLAAGLLTLPLQVATARKLQATAMMLADLTVTGDHPRTAAARAAVTHVISVLGLVGLVLFTLLVSLPLLPPWPLLLLLAALLTAIVFRHGQQLNRLYSRAKGALVDSWQSGPGDGSPEPALPAALREAHVETVVLPAAAPARLIRELALRTRTGASIVARERGEDTLVNPGPDEELLPGDHVLLLGSPDQIARAREIMCGDGPPGAGGPGV